MHIIDFKNQSKMIDKIKNNEKLKTGVTSPPFMQQKIHISCKGRL